MERKEEERKFGVVYETSNHQSMKKKEKKEKKNQIKSRKREKDKRNG